MTACALAAADVPSFGPAVGVIQTKETIMTGDAANNSIKPGALIFTLHFRDG
jgi:hypothetical protein